MRSKRGRPAGSAIRGSRRSSGLTHSQRWTGAEWRQVLDAAKREGIAPSEFIRTTVLKAILPVTKDGLVTEPPSENTELETVLSPTDVCQRSHAVCGATPQLCSCK